MNAGTCGTLVLPASEYARNRGKWLAARRSGLGASEVAAVLGLSPWSTPYKVWAEKVATVPPVEKSTEPIEWGHAAESMIARRVGVRHPELGRVEPSPGLLAHDEVPIVLATLDRLLVPRRSPRGSAPTAPLEIKNIGLPMWRHAWVDGFPPVYYVIQVQVQLAVTGLPYGYLAVLVGGQMMPEPILIERDDAVIAALLVYAAEWWERHVIGGERPALTLADRDILTSLYPGDANLDPLAADPETLAAFAKYVDARRRRDEAVDDMDATGFLVKQALGDHTALTDPDTGAVLATWRPNKIGRRSFLVKETA